MWCPNKAQWWVIWITALIVCVRLLVAFEFTGFMLDAVIVGGLLVWRLGSPSESAGATPGKQQIFCGECGAGLDSRFKHCPECGAPSWKTSGSQPFPPQH